MSSDTPSAATRSDPAPTWKRPFFTLWIGQSISLLGSGLVQFALVWWLTITAHSATVLTTAVLVAILPGVFLAPVAGVLVDRLDRRLVMIVSDSLVALATVGLAVLFALDRVQLWHVYTALCIRGAAGTFQLPAAQASISLMVPEAHFARVQGFNQMLQGVLTIASPPLGALLLGLLPMQGVLAIDVVTAMVGISSLLVVAIPRPSRPPAGEAGIAATSFWRDLREGMAYVRGWPGMVAIMIMATVINFFLVAAASLMPILVTAHFGGQMMQLATLESIFGGGAIIGGLTLGVWGGFRPRILTSLAGLVGIGIGFLLMGLTPANQFGLGLASAFLAAAMIPMANGPIMAVLQATVTPGMQGRVFSLITGVVTAISPVGLAVAGPMADWLGVRAWYVAGGVVCAGMGVAGFFVPAIRRIEEHVQSPVAATESPVTTV